MPERPGVRLLLVRHGVTEWNKDRRYQGQTDIPLSDEGLVQADLVGKRLKDETIDRIYASDLSRAYMTAEAVSRNTGIPIKPDARLRELSFGDWEGLTENQISTRWPEQYTAWLADPVLLSAPGGESAADLGRRLELALSDIYTELSVLTEGAPDDRAPCGVIVAHGGVIRSLLASAKTGSMTAMWSVSVLQASVSECELKGTRLRLVYANDTSHLEGSETTRADFS